MKKLITAIVLITIFIGAYYLFSSSTFESDYYYASDSNSIVFKEELQEGDKILFFYDPKILEGTEAYLIISNSKDEEVLKWDKSRGKHDRNIGELTINERDTYMMKIIFTDPSLANRFAEVEVDWKFVRR